MKKLLVFAALLACSLSSAYATVHIYHGKDGKITGYIIVHDGCNDVVDHYKGSAAN